jgi:hypothetical protein
MPELARRLASRLRQFVGERRRARRAAVSLPVTVSLVPFPLRSNGYRRQTSVEGYTLDISATGLGLILPAIRIRDSYLTGEDRKLWLKLELPDDPVEMQVQPVRYESLEGEGYLVGVHIKEISEEHQAAYVHHIAKILKTR